METLTNVHLMVINMNQIIIITIPAIILTGRTMCLPCNTCRTSRPCHQLLGSLTGGHQDDYDDEEDDEDDDEEDDEEVD